MAYHNGGGQRMQRRTQGRPTETNRVNRVQTTQGQTAQTQAVQTSTSDVEKFTASDNPIYYRSDNNKKVPYGAPLHRHLDTGIIMTEHSMGADDNSVVVYTKKSDNYTYRIPNTPGNRRRRKRLNRPNSNQFNSPKRYYYEGTDRAYRGRVVDMGGVPHTTTSGALEGSSRRLSTAPHSSNYYNKKNMTTTEDKRRKKSSSFMTRISNYIKRRQF